MRGTLCRIGAGAVLDIGYASAQLVLVHQSIVVYHRNLPKCGVQSLARSVARSIGGDEALAESLLAQREPVRKPDLDQALANSFLALESELRIPVSYLANQYPDAAVQRLLLVGGGAGIRGLDSFLASSLNLDVRVATAADLLPGTPSDPPGADNSLALAVGLAEYPRKGAA